MKKTKFSDVKVVEIVRESRVEGVAATARKHKISEQTLYLWRRKFGGMEATQVVELKRLWPRECALEEAACRARPGDRSHAGDCGKKMVSVSGRLAQVRYARKRGMSCTKACAVLQVSRSMLGYRRRQAVKDAQLLRRIRPMARHHPSWGHRLIKGRLALCGEAVSRKRVLRLWRRAGLQCPTRAVKRKICTGERLSPTAVRPNDVWCYDFVHDALVNGETFRGLLIKDEASGYALASDIARSFNASDVKSILMRLFRRYGVPRFLRSDNGPEFIAHALREWLTERGPETAYIDPGKPWQNGASESFNGTYRNEVLDAEVFYSLGEARIISARWRRLYNQRRPHSANNYRPPNTAYHLKQARQAN